MKTENYNIDYNVLSKTGVVIKSGVIKVKNKTSSLQAQFALEDYLKRKVDDYHRMEVNSCKVDYFDAVFGGTFADIFKSKK